MKKIIMVVAVVAMSMAMTGCMSLRTPAAGDRSGKVFYNTFFGISLESAIYGDGLIVNQK